MAARMDGTPNRPGYVKVIWDARVEPGAESGGVVAPVSAALSKRALSAVKRCAEDLDELPRRQASTLALAA